MKLSRSLSLAAVAVLASRDTRAEPCPMFGLALEVLRPQADVAADGGLVVAEVPRMADKAQAPDFSKWQVRGAKLGAPDSLAIAPGLRIIRPPAGAASFTLEVAGKVKGKARVAKAPPPTLPAPAISRVVSGSTTSKHVTRYVTVFPTQAAPKGAIALVLVDAKGKPISWGRTGDGADRVVVYSTEGGCVTTFSNGTEIAQPGERVTAFWIDSTGRRSPASAPITVVKP
ncbi:MAG: hypothetical protein H0V17_28640 [Deltaproteobacteria bacterium]|nr:hypothetical protein [Deltaproteobacteria bacterium]